VTKNNHLFVKAALLTALLVALSSINANVNYTPALQYSRETRKMEKRWVDSVFTVMSEDERIGQLFMVRAHSDKGADHIASVEKLITDYNVGHLCFFQGTPEKQAELTNRYQLLAKRVPMLVAIDGEWGLAMRMKETTMSFPKQLMLGAIQDNHLIYEMGSEIARQCLRIGIHLNFAPDADINNNPKNPIIGERSFGEDRINVATKAYMYMLGMQDANVMACAKHFPGHGDTDVDSHVDMPVIKHDYRRLDSLEMYPFKVLAQHGIQSMMVGHLHVPAIDNTPNRPMSLSERAIKKILREKMGFDGLVFTDGMEMKGVTKYFKSGEAEVQALKAGNDVLCLPESVPAAFTAIKAALQSGRLSQEDINTSVKRILRSKFQLNLTRYVPISLNNIRADLNTPAAQAIKTRLIENAITLVRNEDGILPIQQLENKKIASLAIGAVNRTTFQRRLSNYAKITHFNAEKNIPNSEQLFQNLSKYNTIIVSVHDVTGKGASASFGISDATRQLLDRLNRATKVIFVNFANPYSLKYFDNIGNIVESYSEDETTQDVTAQAIFGALPMRGRLPISASLKSKFGTGNATGSLFRLQYGSPESVGMNSDTLNKIDVLADEIINSGASPSCQVLIAKDGKVIFQKAYGYQTYAKEMPVTTNDLYDVASITKVAASTISVMRMMDEGKISLYNPLSQYLPELQRTNKESMTLDRIMIHQAGLVSSVPVFRNTMTGGDKKHPSQPSSRYYNTEPTDSFSIEVANNMYLRRSYTDTIRHIMRQSDLRTGRDYRYSDVGFYWIADLVKRLNGKPINEYADETFYSPLGLQGTSYLPKHQFAVETIVPTEEDRYFRMQRIQGTVHDMGAAMMGGVSGHAGLFSTTNDLAVLMQMFLNKGYYGGTQYLKPETVQLFTTRHEGCTRRGIGFDMKELDGRREDNMCREANPNTFGHTGFTGGAMWADPQTNLVFVFLSNRTYPTMSNTKFIKKDYRMKAQSIMYQAIMKRETL
jgi:beta-N-acetylhexosaminidase